MQTRKNRTSPRTCRSIRYLNCFRIAVMESRLLDILVCPLCKGRLEHDRQQAELVCRADRLAFPLRDGIPVMLESEARALDDAPAAH